MGAIQRGNATVNVAGGGSYTDATTTANAGLVKRVAARTATVPGTAALTVSASYSQTELQAIVARQEEIRARLADLEAKGVTAGVLT